MSALIPVSDFVGIIRREIPAVYTGLERAVIELHNKGIFDESYTAVVLSKTIEEVREMRQDPGDINAVQWVTLADAASMAHAQQPEKYGADTNTEVVKLRALIKRNGWASKGWAQKTAGNIWLVEKVAVQRYLDESAGKYVR
jgi:hypothetical protein